MMSITARALLMTSRKVILTSIHSKPCLQFKTVRLPMNMNFSTAPNRIKRSVPSAIDITPRALDRIRDIIGDKTDIIGLKIGVKRRGCNGYSYTMNYATEEDVQSKQYEIIQKEDLTVLLDKKAVFFVVGTVMDWEETELSSEFTFNNPNSKGTCGCGESFNV